MKILLMVLLLSACAASAGQYGAPNYRRVRGTLYDAHKSALWRTQMVEQVAMKQGVLVGLTFTNAPRSLRFPDLLERRYGPKVALTNHQDALPAFIRKPGDRTKIPHSAGGHWIQPWAMRVGTFEYEGETMPLWDCGKRAEDP